MLPDVKRTVERNIDTKVVASSAVGVFAAGLVTWVMIKSKIAPLVKTAKAARGGK